jgi:hemerythrin-like metal-binding protein
MDRYRAKKGYLLDIITWNDAISVGVAELDSDHRALIGMINRLNDAVRAGQSETILYNLLEEMKNYAVGHFSREESYLLGIRYPEFQEHREQHAQFVRKVIGFEDAYKKDQALLAEKILPYLIEWLVRHIMESDGKYRASR